MFHVSEVLVFCIHVIKTDSSLFFNSEGNEWKGKPGTYFIEQEALSKKNRKTFIQSGICEKKSIYKNE
jgi:hypothetical protein